MKKEMTERAIGDHEKIVGQCCGDYTSYCVENPDGTREWIRDRTREAKISERINATNKRRSELRHILRTRIATPEELEEVLNMGSVLMDYDFVGFRMGGPTRQENDAEYASLLKLQTTIRQLLKS